MKKTSKRCKKHDRTRCIRHYRHRDSNRSAHRDSYGAEISDRNAIQHNRHTVDQEGLLMKATHSNPFTSKAKCIALSVLLSIFLISMLVTPMMGATVYGEGQNRTLLLESTETHVVNGENLTYEATLNASVPEDISEREVFTGEYTYESDNATIEFNITITTELHGTNESGEAKVYSNTFTVVNTANATATYTLLDLSNDDVDLLDNATLTVTLEDQESAGDEGTLNVNMLSQSVLAFRGVTDLIIAIFPVIVVIGVVIPVIGSLLETLKK